MKKILILFVLLIFFTEISTANTNRQNKISEKTFEAISPVPAIGNIKYSENPNISNHNFKLSKHLRSGSISGILNNEMYSSTEPYSLPAYIKYDTPRKINRNANISIFNDTNISIFKNVPVGKAALYKLTIDEPSVANNGDYVFYTGNFYAARSTDGGSTFTYIDPKADMPTFCCDQDVLYEKTRNLFIWTRLSIEDSNGTNFFRLSISNDNASTWSFVDYYPTNISVNWTNQYFDQPTLALSNNYLYITANMFKKPIGCSYASCEIRSRTIILRLPLDNLKNDKKDIGFLFRFYYQENGSVFGTVQGAKNIIYFGQQFPDFNMPNFTFSLYEWNENTTIVNHYDIKIKKYNIPIGNEIYRCLGPDKINWCGRDDDRIKSGWISNGIIGFIWDVIQGGNYNYPYIQIATFDEISLSYAESEIWNPSYAINFGSIYPNSRGDLGISLSWGGGNYYPSHAIGIADNSSGLSWQFETTNISSNGPNDTFYLNSWGDYLRVRPYNPSSISWIATGYIQNGGNGDNIDPHYIIFGRQKDIPFNNNLKKGDVNGDGKIDILDALLLSQHTIDTIDANTASKLNASQLNAADVDCDGNVNIVDALFIAQYTVGLKTSFC